MAEAKIAPKGEAEPRTLNVRICEVCSRSTALDMCPNCGHDPAGDKARAEAKAATA